MPNGENLRKKEKKMLIKKSQVYFTVESIYWGGTHNRITTLEIIDECSAVLHYKHLRQKYRESDELTKSKTMLRLAKVQNSQSITLACCGYGVMDNFNFADEEPV